MNARRLFPVLLLALPACLGKQSPETLEVDAVQDAPDVDENFKTSEPDPMPEEDVLMAQEAEIEVTNEQGRATSGGRKAEKRAGPSAPPVGRLPGLRSVAFSSITLVLDP